jgi:transcriptional regulator with XRE-family HTH domain
MSRLKAEKDEKYKIFKKEIGKRLREFREKYNVSAGQIGKVIGVSHQQVLKYENGENCLPLYYLYKLSGNYRLSYNYFLRGIV